MVSQSKAEELPAAVAWVIKRLGLKASDILGQSKAARVRLQKVIYILKRAGAPAYSALDYGMYAYGPYSPSLAVIYYMLARQGDEVIERFAGLHKPSKLEEELVEWLSSKDEEWLEAAATILMLASEGGVKRAVKEARRMKPWISKKKLTQAARELVEKGILAAK